MPAYPSRTASSEIDTLGGERGARPVPMCGGDKPALHPTHHLRLPGEHTVPEYLRHDDKRARFCKGGYRVMGQLDDSRLVGHLCGIAAVRGRQDGHGLRSGASTIMGSTEAEDVNGDTGLRDTRTGHPAIDVVPPVAQCVVPAQVAVQDSGQIRPNKRREIPSIARLPSGPEKYHHLRRTAAHPSPCRGLAG